MALPGSGPVRFARDDEQLIALNYENLCDSEYLNRLFVSVSGDAPGGSASEAGHGDSQHQSQQSGVGIGGTSATLSASGLGRLTSRQQQQQVPQQHAVPVAATSFGGAEGWSLTADMPEDVIVFGGEALAMGHEFQERRFLASISTLSTGQDALSALVYKQVLVFEHIGRLMMHRCSMVSSSGSGSSSSSSSKKEKAPPASSSPAYIKNCRDERECMSQLAGDALLCAIRVLESQSRRHIRQATVEPLLSLVVNLFKSFGVEGAPGGTSSEGGQISRQHLQYLRAILCNGMCKMSQENARLEALGGGGKESDTHKEELLRLALCCAYGLLTIGLYADSIGDVLVAVAHIMAITMQTEEWLEDIAINLRTMDDAQAAAADAYTSEKEMKKMQIKAKLAEKADSHLDSANWSSRPNSGSTSAATQPAKAGTKFFHDDYESRGSELPEKFDSHDMNNNTSFAKSRPAVSTGMSFSSTSLASSSSVSAMKVVLDKDAKSKIRVVKSRQQNEANGSEDLILSLSQFGQQQHFAPSKETVLKDKANPKLSKASAGSNNNDDRLVPGRPSSSKADKEIQQQSAAAASAFAKPKSASHRPFKDLLHNLSRIPKSILSIVQDCSSKLATQEAKLNTYKSPSGDGSGRRSHGPQSFTGNSYVWTCGQNSYGELGHGDQGQRKVFTRAHFLEGKCVVSIGAGNEHSVFVSKSGQMFVCGYNDNGQCGMGSTQQVRQLSQVTSLEGEEITQVHIYNGCEHTLAVSRDGKLYSFGYNYRGQLGLGTTNSESTPRPVKSLLSRKVSLAACSYHHSMILCADGALFSVGRNDCGQLGHGDTVDKKVPHLVQNCPKCLTSISCGQFHTIAATSGGTAFVCGKNDYGQLGFESPENVKVLTKLPRENGQPVLHVCSGYYHTLLLMQNGVVVGFGRNDYGQLGLGHAQPRVHGPHVIASLRDKNVVNISAGCYHSIAITSNGMLYVFGRNNHGQLGTGDVEEKHLPHPVDDFVGQRVIQVAAGFYHTIVLAVDAQNEGSADAIITKEERLFSALLDNADEADEAMAATLSCAGSSLAAVNSQDNPIATSKINFQSQGDLKHAKAISAIHAHPTKGFSLDFRSSKTNISELLPFLVGHLESLVRLESMRTPGDNFQKIQTDLSLDVLSSLDPDPANRLHRSANMRDISWIYRQLRSISVLMSLCRQCAMSTHTLSEMPLSANDTICLICTLVRTADFLLKRYGAEFAALYRYEHEESSSLGMEKDPEGDDGDNVLSGDLWLHPSPMKPIAAADLIDYIHKLTSEFFQASDENDRDGRSRDSPGKLARSTLGDLRQELLLTYFHLPEDEENNQDGVRAAPGSPFGRVVREIASCLTHHFEVLFPTAALRSHFFTLLGNTLTIQDSDFGHDTDNDYSHIDYNRCTRLFSRVCFKYRGNGEVVKLFRSSHLHGLVIFQQLLAVYSCLSMRCLEQKMEQHFANSPSDTASRAIILSESGDMFRAVGVLEHCNANFVKCAIPIIFNSPAGPIASFGLEIIRGVFQTAQSVIDFTLQQSSNDDLLSLLRCGTVIPSVLPTILMLGISCSESKEECCVQELLPEVRSLLRKLQTYGRFEIDGNSLAAGGGAPSRGRQNYKADVSQMSWWSRLLKLTVILNAKLGASLLMNQAQPESTGKMSDNSAVLDKQLLHHPIWRYLSSPVRFGDLEKMAPLLEKGKEVASLVITSPRPTSATKSPRPSSSSGLQRPSSATYRISPVSTSHLQTTPIRISVSNICTDLRQREMITDHTYRVLCQSKGNNGGNAAARYAASAYVENIEQMILDVIVHVDGNSLVDFAESRVPQSEGPVKLHAQNKQANKRLCRMWSCVAKLTKLIHSKRSQLMPSSAAAQEISSTQCDNWHDIVVQLHKLISLAREMLLMAQPLMSYSILPFPICPVQSCSSNAKRAFRRCVLVVISSLRWRACCRAKVGCHWVGISVVHFFATIIERSTLSFTAVDCGVMQAMWSKMVAQLTLENSRLASYTCGISRLSSLLREVSFISMKNDVLAVLARAWRDMVDAEQKSHSVDALHEHSATTWFNAYFGDVDFSEMCCTVAVRDGRKEALRTLIQQLVDIILDFAPSGGQFSEIQGTLNEATQLHLAIKLIHLYCLTRRDGVLGLPTQISPSKLSSLLLSLVCDGCSYGVGDSLAVEEKIDALSGPSSLQAPTTPTSSNAVSGGTKKPSSRERSRALRRAAGSIISLLQEFSARTKPAALGSKGSTTHSCDQLLNIHCNLLSQFQSSRLAASRIDIDSTGFSGKVGESGNKAGGKDAPSASGSNKRRCQELITKPMEFCRSQEGFVVQGDKLLNNYKGMDFTLATWILVTKKITAQQNFITGKVSHNDAWPLVSLKNDGRLEILYGHGSEFERLTSQTGVPLFGWTHVAVVVEPKKIKLFINGALDSQVNTKGNGRAILYPVVVGSCPLGVRTRVDHVREGFDGMLACYKYYTRALSPIHVRVVFDQGPPESYDALERWLYQLLASTRSLSIAVGPVAFPETVQRLASTLHMLFVTDSAGRLRSGALLLLKEVLKLDVLSDMHLSSNRSAGADPQATEVESVLVSQCAFLQLEPSVTSGQGDAAIEFRIRMVLYFLRVIGSSWIPSLSAIAEDPAMQNDPRFLYKQSLEHLFQSGTNQISAWTAFLDFVPAFLSERPTHSEVSSFPANADHSHGGDKQTCRTDSANELCVHVCDLLQTLSQNSLWSDAITTVLCSVFEKSRDAFAVPVRSSTAAFPGENNRSQLLLADALGGAIFLGGFSAGAHVGTNAETFFCDSVSRVLNFNKTTNFAAVLHWNSAGTMHQIATIRVNDLVGMPLPPVRLQPALVGACVAMVNTLRHYTPVLAGDLMALFRPDHNFTKHVMLKASRPVEVFFFGQMLQALASVPASVTAAQSGLAELMTVLQQTAPRAMRLQSATDDLSMDRLLPSLWNQCSRYLFFLPDDIALMEFPPADGERWFLDYLAKHMGIAAETFQNPAHDRFLRQGSLSELVQSVAFGNSAGLDGISKFSQPPVHTGQHVPENMCHVTDWIGYISGTGTASAGVARAGFGGLGGGDNDLTEAESNGLVKFLYQLRRNIIQRSRNLLNLLSAPRSAAGIEREPAQGFGPSLLLWLTLAPTTARSPPIELAGPVSLADGLRARRVETTQCLASSLRYTSISLLQLASSKSAGNILETTDVFTRLVRGTNAWLEMHQGHEYESELSFHLLRMLLPSLSFIESSEVELQIMRICRKALHRLVVSFLKGSSLDVTREVMDLAKSNNFTLLRARAQEQLSRQRGQVQGSSSSLAFNLTQLAAGLEIIQRKGCYAGAMGERDKDRDMAATGSGSTPVQSPQALPSSPFSGGKQFTNAAFASPSGTSSRLSTEEIQLAAATTAPPRIISARANSVDADLHACAASAATPPASASASPQADGASPAGTKTPSCSDFVLVEVAIGVLADGEETIYETVYCGNSFRFVQSGLCSGCSYNMRCRAILGVVALQWSPVVTFRTEQGVPFIFDPLKRGPDILLSDDGLTASYAGDDCWSTLFGTQSFSSGVTSWEIRIAQSSTAYVFVGVASSAADLNTFLGGCPNGWGFIGEQALYHNREKVKIYGESFSAGDVVGVVLDLNNGILSFSRNGKMLGVAFDKIYGELFPAVAFYNVGQELEIVVDGFQTTCPEEPIPCSPCRLHTNDVSTATELMICMSRGCPFSPRVLGLIADQCNQWCGGQQKRYKAVSGLTVLLECASPLLRKYGLFAGERVRTPYGVAEVAGTAFNRVWFVMNEANQVWFFSRQQLLQGRENGMFFRCTYEPAHVEPPLLGGDGGGFSSPFSASLLDDSYSSPIKGNASAPSAATPIASHASSAFDAAYLAEMLHPSRWSLELDAALVSFLLKHGEADSVQAWNISASAVHRHFRSLQQTLSRIVRGDAVLSHRWGFAGPKRRAVIARLGMLRLLNCTLDRYLPVFLDPPSSGVPGSPSYFLPGTDDPAEPLQSFPDHRVPDDFQPLMLSVAAAQGTANTRLVLPFAPRRLANVRYSFASRAGSDPALLSGGGGDALLPPLRECIFTDIKMRHFWEVVSRTAARPAKTDDDYDYPDDLPQLKINRLKSFRAREASELHGIPGEDLLQASMFCQLWRELRRHASDKLRISYTHPMDDGQARAFKIRFDGEGVDDYGGPYREIFQQICDELQSPDPSAMKQSNGSAAYHRPKSWAAAAADASSQADGGPGGADEAAKTPIRCFLPLLHPSPNWSAGECAERYCYVFHPASTCEMRQDLFRFMGQLAGIALRSRVTMDLSLPSFIWKSLVRATICDTDLASFDMPASDFVQHLVAMHDRLHSPAGQGESNAASEAADLVQDLTWTAVRCDGRVVDLVPQGSTRPVLVSEIREYVTAYVECRLGEFGAAVECFRQGLLSVIPESAISLLCWEELRGLVCGARGVDVQRLRENTEYDDDVSAEDAHIVAFWEVLADFSEEEKMAFLRFVWARPTLPPKGVAFPQKMKVQNAVGDDAQLKPDQYLPRAHTCFFSINLPRYSSKEVRTLPSQLIATNTRDTISTTPFSTTPFSNQYNYFTFSRPPSPHLRSWLRSCDTPSLIAPRWMQISA